MNLFRKASESLKDKHKVHLQVEQLDERLVPAVTASVNNAGVLVVTGDSLSNSIRIEGVGLSGDVRVFADGQYVNIASGGSYYASVRPVGIEIYGRANNDTIWTDSLGNFQGNILMSGDAGNDLLSMAYATSYGQSVLIGDGGSDILVGGRHTDALMGLAGRDLLIGGKGADHLYGGDEQDLLMPGDTKFNLDRPALRQIRSFWARTDLTYSERVKGLVHATNGYTGRRVNASTVYTDSDRDEMYGEAGMDCFFSDFSQDIVRDTSGTGEWLLFI